MNAPLVPLPSSRETTAILPPTSEASFLSLPQPITPKANIAAKAKLTVFFIFII